MKKEKNTRTKKKVLAVGAAAALCTLMLGTFAWEVYKDAKENKFGNAIVDGSIEIVEDFPKPEMPLDVVVKKEVELLNNSAKAVFMRATFEETMQNLANTGKDQATVKDYLKADLDPTTHLPTANAKAIPQITDVNAKYTTTMNTNPMTGWADITSTITPALDTDVVIMAKTVEKTIVQPDGSTIKGFETEFQGFRKLTLANIKIGEVASNMVPKLTENKALVATKISFVGKQVLDNAATPEIAPTHVDHYEITDVKYPMFEGYGTPKLANWGNDPMDLHLGGTLAPSKPATSAVSVADANVQLTYDATVMDNTTPTATKWYYNAADGYFYYIGLVNSGAKTPMLLKSVKLDSTNAGSEYAYLDYSLWIDAQGMFPNKAALSNEWGLTAGPLLTALEALIPAT